ncbi:MAG TPA: hypothetical protein VGB53_13445 [Rubricoccaceae bacterium]
MSDAPDLAPTPDGGGRDDSGAWADEARVHAMLDAYGAAFEAYDAPAIAAHFAVPTLLVRDGTTTTLDSPADVLDSVERLLDLHRAWGVETSRIAALAVVETAPAHVIARVDWRLGRRASRLRWTYTTTYVLVPGAPGGLLIAAALTHDAPF